MPLPAAYKLISDVIIRLYSPQWCSVGVCWSFDACSAVFKMKFGEKQNKNRNIRKKNISACD